jgi:hypothetical protein
MDLVQELSKYHRQCIGICKELHSHMVMGPYLPKYLLYSLIQESYLPFSMDYLPLMDRNDNNNTCHSLLFSAHKKIKIRLRIAEIGYMYLVLFVLPIRNSERIERTDSTFP